MHLTMIRTRTAGEVGSMIPSRLCCRGTAAPRVGAGRRVR